jgi:hypothetical protein
MRRPRRTVLIGASALALVVGGSAGALALGQSVSAPAAALSNPEAAATAQAALPNVMATVSSSGTTQVSIVQSTRQQANTLISGDWVDSDQPVVVVSLTGRFTYLDASGGPGQAAPSGTSLTFTVDDATGQRLDLSVTNSAPDLTALGTVQTLASLPATAAAKPS